MEKSNFNSIGIILEAFEKKNGKCQLKSAMME
jgi:hypothetical protein